MKVHEIFSSVQGEGVDVGLVASFVRFAGCFLKCRYCDTQEAKTGGVEFSQEEIINKLKSLGVPDIVVTGGEPLSQDGISNFLFKLSSETWVKRIFVETSGFFFKSDIFVKKVFVNISPKPPSMEVDFPLKSFENFIVNFYDRVQVKFLILTEEDLAWILKIVREYKDYFSKKGIVFQPIEVPGKPYSESVKTVIDLVMREKPLLSRFNVRVIPQIHKLVGIK
ncbi:7-carboxy-7-deazaguanine synthase QueE [Desulfurobacterium sp.]